MNDMYNIIVPEPEDYRAVMDRSIEATYQSIREALGYIERQEDGPLTMTYALRTIQKHLSAVESESWYLTSELARLRALIDKLLEQRDEAIRQRDLLMLIAWSKLPDDPNS